jgi:hypothetical protein
MLDRVCYKKQPRSLTIDLELFLEVQGLQALQSALKKLGICDLEDLLNLELPDLKALLATAGKSLSENDEMLLSRDAVESFQELAAKASTTEDLLQMHEENGHLIFLSHFKVEAGSDAALMRKELTELLQEGQGHLECGSFGVPVFLDSEDLANLDDLLGKVRSSRNLAILLTEKVLTRPWVLMEIVTAVRHGVEVLPVLLLRPGNVFRYPDEMFYRSLQAGTLLPKDTVTQLQEQGIDFEVLEHCLRTAFKRISISYSPHQAASIRKAELENVLKQCHSKRKRPMVFSDFCAESQTLQMAQIGALKI